MSLAIEVERTQNWEEQSPETRWARILVLILALSICMAGADTP